MSSSLREFLETRPEYGDKAKRARLAYLYSDLSQARLNNPTSFASSVSWWSNLLSDIVSKGLQDGGGASTATSDKLVMHLNQELLDRLRWEGAGRPTGLGTVAIHLSRATSAQILPLNAFETSVKPVDSFSWASWFLSKTVTVPLWWSMSKLGLVDSNDSMPESKAWKLADGSWVMMDTLKKAAEAVMARLPTESNVLDRLFTLEGFNEAFAAEALPGVKLTSLDMRVLLKYLQRDRQTLIRDGNTVKVLSEAERDVAGVSVTQAEKGILQVKSTSAALEAQIQDLEARIAQRQDKIANYIRSNQRDLALSHLRSKKGLTDLLSKRTLAFENLQAVLMKIEAAESDVAILSAYQSATSSLRSLLAHPSLQKEHVENTMDAMQDALADQKEIEDVIKIGGQQTSGLDVTEDEIEEELRQMQREADEEKRKKVDEEALQAKQPDAEVDKPAAARTKEAIVHREAQELRDDLRDTVPA